MMFLMALRLALRSLLRNRMRSALTALGVIIGVAALLVTVVLGEGTRKMVAAQIATMGSAIIMIVPGASAQGGFMGGTGSGRPLQRDEFGGNAGDESGDLGGGEGTAVGAQQHHREPVGGPAGQ